MSLGNGHTDLHFGAPIVPVRNVAEAIGFYETHLGFTKGFASDDGAYGIVNNGPVCIHLQWTDDASTLAVTASNMSMYIGTSDVDELYRKVMATKPDTQTRAPFDQPYGMREFHIKDPNGFLIFFGQDLLQR
ncbi:COG0346: Lactoylglutathione lyase and related lyases [Candidatus Phaeomarinobacter ectocarpi]|uniref:Bleomycin resistance protein n=1 Tax=Candidatus Phaeomarinibacter ectocarpi TaxID=1458461 RepID=X5MMV0_9HYPH|nr:VOC family protein [Candidatus Phaeomarinobacter ectocarpi]CDO59566.1 COG0346: Lactoylglutathione lyase and related lyases [Candidatus Phaeomarinobacter ectocarpi]